MYYEASLDYLEDPNQRPDSRNALGAVRMELNSSDQFAFEFSNQFESIDAAFPVTPGLIVPIGAYEFRQAKFMVTSSPQRPVSGTLVLTRGGFYGGTLNETTWRGRVELGPQLQLEPAISLNYFDTPWGKGDAHLISTRADLHRDAEDVRVGAGAVSVVGQAGDDQRAVQMGVLTRQRAVRRLQRRPQHVPSAASHRRSRRAVSWSNLRNCFAYST